MFHPTPSALAAVLLFAGQKTLATHLFVSHYSGEVYTLTYEHGSSGGEGNGTLSVDSSTDGCGNAPSWLTLDRTSGTLYCFDESYGGGVVSSYEIDDAGLTLTGQAKTGGGDVHGWLYGGGDGNGFLARVAYGTSKMSTNKLPLSADSEVLQEETFSLAKPGPDPRQDVSHPHAAFTDPTGEYLVVPDLGADLIRIFGIDAASGELSACTSAAAGAGDGPRHGAFWKPDAGSTEGLMLYTINELSSTVTGWEVRYADGGCLSLSKSQTVSTYASGSPPSSGSLPVKASEIHVRDNFLYAANRNDQTFGAGQDSLATYNISSAGVLDFVEATNAHAWYPRTFSINRAGDLVAVGGQTSSNIAIIARDVETGRLGELLADVEVGPRGTDGGGDGLSAVTWNWSTETSL